MMPCPKAPPLAQPSRPMDILLIAPASGNWRAVGRQAWINGRTFRFSLLSLLSVAAETPPGAQVRIVDEQVDVIPWADPVDLVGITCMTATAPRAYEIADRFRARGVPVVLGGMHPTFCPDEAAQHADAVVLGEAEGLWPQVVNDVRQKRLQRFYRHATPPDLRGLKPLPRHLLASRRYATAQAVQATRGCPHGCDFCAVAAFHQRTHRCRPVDEVVREVAELRGRFFVFVDDNLVANRAYALALFKALRPLHKRWISQVTLSLAEDTELLELAAEAGCIGVFVGLETFSAGNLEAIRKLHNKVERYREAIRQFHAHGIGVEAGIVFGLPGDRADVFARTLQLLDALEVDAVLVSIFTPLPGTPRGAAMAARILDRNWAHYDFHHVVFEPWGMTAEALQAGHDWVTHQFYRPWWIIRRLVQALFRPRFWRAWPYIAALNVAFYGRVLQWHIRGWNPAAELAGSPSPFEARGQPCRLTAQRATLAVRTLPSAQPPPTLR
jgi:radical SAM superfamily enzyme YgiQ (UPF0313 family)